MKPRLIPRWKLVRLKELDHHYHVKLEPKRTLDSEMETQYAHNA